MIGLNAANTGVPGSPDLEAVAEMRRHHGEELHRKAREAARGGARWTMARSRLRSILRRPEGVADAPPRPPASSTAAPGPTRSPNHDPDSRRHHGARGPRVAGRGQTSGLTGDMNA